MRWLLIRVTKNTRLIDQPKESEAASSRSLVSHTLAEAVWEANSEVWTRKTAPRAAEGGSLLTLAAVWHSPVRQQSQSTALILAAAPPHLPEHLYLNAVTWTLLRSVNLSRRLAVSRGVACRIHDTRWIPALEKRVDMAPETVITRWNEGRKGGGGGGEGGGKRGCPWNVRSGIDGIHKIFVYLSKTRLKR